MAIKVKKINVMNLKKAEDMFTDRTDGRNAFWNLYNSLQAGEADIIHYYGVGGIGKTSLLKQLRLEISQKYDNTHKMSIYYNFERNQSKADFLFILSRQIMLRSKEAKFPVFDYALEKWMKGIGKTNAEIESYLKAKENEILRAEDVIDQISGIVSDYVPFMNTTTAAAKGIIGFCEKEWQKHVLQNEENRRIVYEIDSLNEKEIERLLVKYFAHDAAKVLNQFMNPLVIMLDGYEALVNILRDGDEKSFLADSWLHKEDGLVYLLPNVCWVIAGREQLRWDEELLPENHKHLMGQISSMDAKSYFHQIGIWDNDLIEDLYQLTGGTPVYMDWCYKKYLQLINEVEPGYHLTVDDFGKNTSDLAERYLRDMSPTHQDVIRIMCCLPDMWDDELYTWAAKESGYLECLGEVFNKVKELSLIEKQNNFYKVHETFRTVVLDFITKEKKKQISENVFKYLFAILDGEIETTEKLVVIKHFVQSLNRIGQYVNWNDEKLEKLTECSKAFENDIRYQEQLEVAIDICSFVKEITGGERSLNYLYAMHYLVEAYDNVGQYNKALELAEQVYQFFIRILGESHPETLISLGILASFYGKVGQYDKALELEEQVYQSQKQILGESHSKTLVSLEMLAAFYGQMCQYDKSLELAEKVYQSKKRILGESHPETLTSLGNLVKYYKNLGQYDKLLELAEKVYQSKKRILGESHPETLTSLGNLANLYEDASKYNKSLELTEQMYQSEKKIYGENHPNTLTSLRKLAFSYGQVGQYDKELDLAEQVYQSEKKLLGESHPDTLRSLIYLAKSYENVGQYDKSLELTEQVYQSRKQILGESHPDTLITLNYLARSYGNVGQYDKELELAERVYQSRKQILGEMHSETIKSLNYLVVFYGKTGQYSKSLELAEQVYQSRKQILGENHPDTLNSLGNLGVLYGNVGQYDKELEFAEQTYQAEKQILGEKHLDTLISLKNLAVSYKNRGQYDKSIELAKQAYEMAEAEFGNEHPFTQNMSDYLESLNKHSS